GLSPGVFALAGVRRLLLFLLALAVLRRFLRLGGVLRVLLLLCALGGLGLGVFLGLLLLRRLRVARRLRLAIVVRLGRFLGRLLCGAGRVVAPRPGGGPALLLRGGRRG